MRQPAARRGRMNGSMGRSFGLAGIAAALTMAVLRPAPGGTAAAQAHAPIAASDQRAPIALSDDEPAHDVSL